jgi:hypothetical protein
MKKPSLLQHSWHSSNTTHSGNGIRTDGTKCTTMKMAKTGNAVEKKEIWNPIR